MSKHTDTSRSGDLVERLREQYGNLRSGISQYPLEAADRIEALEAENERLRAALQSVTPPPHFGESEQNKAWWAKARAALKGTEG